MMYSLLLPRNVVGICIGCIVAKTNILMCVIGTNVPTCFRKLCVMLDTMFQHPGTVQCAWLYAYLYVRFILFKETIFPYRIDQAMRISVHNQFCFIPKGTIIF